MIVWFSTVIRSAPPRAGGELVKLDWDAKRVLARVPVAPTAPDLDDPNPRGNTRGGRGILVIGDEVAVCSYHSLVFFDRELRERRRFSHPLMVSLHEVARDDGTVWTTSTAIDAALAFDLASGELTRACWPREERAFQQALGVTPLSLDKAADNRGRFLGSEHVHHPHHLHLNAVALHGGEVYALFAKLGVIANLDRGTVVARDPSLKGGHNLRVDDAGHAYISHTVNRGVLVFDLRSGARLRRIGFAEAPAVRRLARRHDLVYRVRRFLERRGLHPDTPPRPVFVRGLARHDGRLFVGISPATILQLDEASGAVVDAYVHSRDVRVCVHGLEVDP